MGIVVVRMVGTEEMAVGVIMVVMVVVVVIEMETVTVVPLTV